MKTLALDTAPDYYQNYIRQVDDKPLLEILTYSGVSLFENYFEELTSVGDKTYAKDKWTVREIIQHLIDTERIFINRALRFVRQDRTELPGYDHNAYVPVSRANDKLLSDLIAEYKAVRQSTVHFYKHLNENELMRTGTANGVEISVLAMGYVLVGHPIHHFNVIRERYFNL